MQSLITHSIQVSVESLYQEKLSSEHYKKFVYIYHITIENFGEYPVKLLHRHWYLQETPILLREVEGVGVVGEQPVLYPNDKFEYNSWTQIQSDIEVV